MTQSTVRQPRMVFLSYAHADASGFAERLVRDIETRAHKVWWDSARIEGGARFDIRIERGILGSDVLASVITKRALEEDCICRDEAFFAFNANKPIVPLRLQAGSGQSLLFARRSWIDFSSDYDKGLEHLLRYLAGDATALMEPELAWVSGARPIDSGPELARYLKDFTTRDWLQDRILAWINGSSSRMLAIVGGPGAGKSAIAAWLSLSTAFNVVAMHFCDRGNPKTLSGIQFVSSVVAQLHATLPHFAELVSGCEPRGGEEHCGRSGTVPDHRTLRASPDVSRSTDFHRGRVRSSTSLP